MIELFADLPEALTNNYNFPLRCSFRPSFSNPILPNISSEKDGNADQILMKNSFDGLRKKFEKQLSSLPYIPSRDLFSRAVLATFSFFMFSSILVLKGPAPV